MIWWPTEVPTLQYGLITLRKPEERDITSIFEGVQDPLIPRFTRIPANYQLANAEHYVRERSPNGFTLQTEIQLVLEYDGNFAGAVSFHTLVLDEAKAEIGYWITANARGKGIATAATKLLTGYGFETIGFQRIEALVVESNKPSLKVLSNAGYLQEGVLRDKSCCADGSRENMVLFAALRNEWGS
jgi:RimJ/RimL family protein N-acetyltransferase